MSLLYIVYSLKINYYYYYYYHYHSSVRRFPVVHATLHAQIASIDVWSQTVGGEDVTKSGVVGNYLGIATRGTGA